MLSSDSSTSNTNGHASELFLRELSLQHLHSNVRMVLASTLGTSALDKPAELADHFMEVTPTGVIATVNNIPDISAEVEHLRDEVSRLEKLVRKLSYSSQYTSCSASRCPHRLPIPQHTSDSPDQHSSQTPDSFCWYHQKFGRQAQFCRSPCSYQLNSQAKT